MSLSAASACKVMGLISLADIEESIECDDATDILKQEVDNINNTILDAVATVNHSIEALERLIIVRRSLQSKLDESTD